MPLLFTFAVLIAAIVVGVWAQNRWGWAAWMPAGVVSLIALALFWTGRFHLLG